MRKGNRNHAECNTHMYIKIINTEMVIWKHATVVRKGSVPLNFCLDCLRLDNSHPPGMTYVQNIIRGECSSNSVTVWYSFVCFNCLTVGVQYMTIWVQAGSFVFQHLKK
jgi:hypothetical protein